MPATKAAVNKGVRQEALREYLSNQGLVQKVVDSANKLDKDAATIEAVELQAIKAAADIRIKLIGKYLPDLKSQEVTGADGGELLVSILKKRFDGE